MIRTTRLITEARRAVRLQEPITGFRRAFGEIPDGYEPSPRLERFFDEFLAGIDIGYDVSIPEIPAPKMSLADKANFLEDINNFATENLREYEEAGIIGDWKAAYDDLLVQVADYLSVA